MPLTALVGKTPGQTVYSVLYAEAKKPTGIFKQTDRGEFQLDKFAVEQAEKQTAENQATKDAQPEA